MGRPVYSYELSDPDFSWLITNFQENFPEYCFVEGTTLPVVFIGERLDKDIEIDPTPCIDSLPKETEVTPKQR